MNTYRRTLIKMTNGKEYTLSNAGMLADNLKANHEILTGVNGVEYVVNNNNMFAYKLIPNSKTFRVEYTKAIGGTGSILVKAPDADRAIKCASMSCATGKDFRNAVETTEAYIKPLMQGFKGYN